MGKEMELGIRRNVVAIGSSAGGLNALTVVLSTFPPNLPASVLIVQHMDPRYPSHLAEILGRRIQMLIVEAKEGDIIDPSVAYLAPPDHHMLVEGGRIRLTTTELVHFSRPSIDLMFESVAAAYGSRVVGVVLTGSGTDGSVGIRAIKEKGGMTIAQDPTTADSTGMPNAAINTGAIDIIAALDDIGQFIMNAVSQEETHA